MSKGLSNQRFKIICIGVAYSNELRQDFQAHPTLIRRIVQRTAMAKALRETKFQGTPWLSGILPTDKLLWIDLPEGMIEYYSPVISTLNEAVFEEPNRSILRNAYRNGNREVEGRKVNIGKVLWNNLYPLAIIEPDKGNGYGAKGYINYEAGPKWKMPSVLLEYPEKSRLL